MKLILAVFAASLFGPSAYAADCNSFALKTDNTVTITRDETSLTLTDDGEAKRYEIAVEKHWGELTEVAVDTSGETKDAFPMRMINVDGKEALVFASSVFIPTCK